MAEFDYDAATILEAALHYGQLGFPVLPAGGDKGKDPGINGKGWQEKATTDPEKIRALFASHPGANVAIMTGGDFWVIDVDQNETKQGMDRLIQWEKENGALPMTVTAHSATGGTHYYFRKDPERELDGLNSGQPDNLQHIDVRGKGMVIIAPPSVNPQNGKKYQWEIEPDRMPMAEPDAVVKTLYRELKSGSTTTKSDTAGTIKPAGPSPVDEQTPLIKDGQRHGTLLHWAGKWIDEGLPGDVIDAGLLQLAKHSEPPTPSDADVLQISHDAQKRYNTGRLFQPTADPEPAPNVRNMAQYLNSGKGFSSDLDYFRKYKDRKTGFTGIDRNFTLYPGLSVLGGASSTGKTTFLCCLADNLTAAGEQVLFFELEQNAAEITAKILARRDYTQRKDQALTNSEIKAGSTDAQFEQLKADYANDTAGRLHLVNCSFTITTEQIQTITEDFIKSTGCRPIVLIDYFQLISPPPGMDRATDKQVADANIKALKKMQLKNELFVLCVSSFNRTGYENPANFSDFKESGLVEYSADSCFELELSVLEEPRFYHKPTKSGEKATDAQEKAEMIAKAQKGDYLDGEPYREILFVSLKNRNGLQSFKAPFMYFYRRDEFIDNLGLWEKYNGEPFETEERGKRK